MNLNMLIWVTSDCNLRCPLCIVQNTQRLFPGYQMSLEEVRFFIQSSLERKIRYDIITFTGGEPTCWSHLQEATRLIYESGITEHISLISNGCNPDSIFDISSMLSVYAISETQMPVQNKERFEGSGNSILYNTGKHIPRPTSPILNSLPAICCNATDFSGLESNQLHYVCGKVYYCCNVLNFADIVPVTPDLVCDFTSDFISYFSNKKYDKEVCLYCLCNSKVWNTLI